MKKIFILIFIIICSSIGYASDISDTFTEKYKSFVPVENSSVHSDYLFEQIALGTEYTVRMLDQLNENNEKLNEKVDIMIEKFDILIEQNKIIIKLLEK
ncbi:MAG: hypothetical protein K8S13_22365 [Desulfobacula sp.]|uniref:hypothetical protein n=1 Tax=Desulfobacula sp. TaxID=2593537 RepID=UPI0025B8966E|nr:hypothetical protein [Desulfobacula sp.]MCD4722575.1 hypothetical protein [Desulfobacula sp.]